MEKRTPTQAEALIALADAINRNTEVVAGLNDLAGEIRTLRERLERWPRETAKAIAHQRRSGEQTRAALAAHVAELQRIATVTDGSVGMPDNQIKEPR